MSRRRSGVWRSSGAAQTDIDHLRDLTRYDWLDTPTGQRLHYADLPDLLLIDLEADGRLDGPVRLACGQLVAFVVIPGIFTRMNLARCRRCCKQTVLPPGKGSPKNDPACRAILGLKEES